MLDEAAEEESGKICKMGKEKKRSMAYLKEETVIREESEWATDSLSEL